MPGNEQNEQKDVRQSVDAEARRLAKTLLRKARYAALGTLEVSDGAPSVSRVSLATAMDGAPGFLISALSGHTANLATDQRCSLLVGEPGKGDPLAHPRMTLIGRARKLEAGAHKDAFERRYLSRHPKASLYAGFSDFSFWVVKIDRGYLNGGFGKAFTLTAADLATPLGTAAELVELEPSAIAHMNADHREAVDHYAGLAGGIGSGWRLACLDPEGLDLAKDDQVARLWFEAPLTTAANLRATLVSLAQSAAPGTQASR
jgi:putative heme iron utilization protein